MSSELDTTSLPKPENVTPLTPAEGVVRHVRAFLESRLAEERALEEKIESLERTGRRIVSGGQVSYNGWNITDWRTGELLAEGTGGIDEYSAVVERLDPDGAWFEIDNLHNEELDTWEPFTSEWVPGSLAQYLNDWAEARGTSHEDVAELIDWPVEKVTRCLTEAGKGDRDE